MASNELLIRINADAKNATKAFDDIRKKTEDLEGTLNKASLVGAAVFAALSAEVIFSVHAFSEAEQASNQLTQALQNQGIFTTKLREDYKGYADAVSKATGVDDDALVKSQAIAQSFLGQSKVTEELTQLIADLATKTGSLDSAAQLIGRSIGTSTNALARQGVTIKEGSTQAERYKQVMEQLSVQVGGQAAAAEKAGLGFGRLKTVMGNVQEALGARFAPAVATVISKLTELFDKIANSPKLLDFAAAAIAATAAVAGMVAVVGPLVAGYASLVAIAGVLGTTVAALVIPFAAVAVAVAALVGAGVLLYQNWAKIMLSLKASTASFVTEFSEKFAGLRKIIEGAFDRFNTAKMKEGLDQINNARAKADEEYRKVYAAGLAKIEADTRKHEETQDKKKAEAAKREHDRQSAEEARAARSREAADNVQLLQLRKASAELIALKTEEANLIKNLETEKNANVIRESEARILQLQELEAQQAIDDQARYEEAAIVRAESEKEFADLGMAERDVMREQELEAQAKAQLTEATASRAVALEINATRQAARNQELQDRIKYGATVAAINKVLHSTELNNAQEAAASLATLQRSKNSTLAEIGRAAAKTQIAIDTARAAMAVYTNFQSMGLPPFISIPLGLAAAAATVAYGAERIGEVGAAANGALVGGTRSQGGTGDVNPFMLEKGELVAPARNFDQVVNGVQTERSGIIDEVRAKLGQLTSAPAGGGTTVNITTGDVLASDSYIDRLAEKISEAVQFGNTRLIASGVNA
jgi:hypothetical protein